LAEKIVFDHVGYDFLGELVVGHEVEKKGFILRKQKEYFD
jgi:hypothetical protein